MLVVVVTLTILLVGAGTLWLVKRLKRQNSTKRLVLHSTSTLPLLASMPLRRKPWHIQHIRLLTSLCLLTMILIALCFQSGLADGALRSIALDFNMHPFTADNLSVAAHPMKNASKALVRLWQVDPAQYKDRAEFDLWAYAACSAASMTEVINAWGHTYHITDILQEESAIGEITPDAGLLHPEGIEKTVAHFGFKTSWGTNWQLNQVLDSANSGKPVIVSFPPDRYAGGHLLVVIGGDANNVYLADSSGYNRKSLTRGQFLQWWEGFAAVVTP